MCMVLDVADEALTVIYLKNRTLTIWPIWI